MRTGAIILLLICWAGRCFAQDSPKAYFLADSAKIGERIFLSVAYAHHAEATVLLEPDSADFAPFTYIGKQVFTTRTQNGISTDSVLYQLAMFDLQPVQYLSVPVKIQRGKELVVVQSNTDSIRMLPTVTQIPDSVSVKINTNYYPVPQVFNYQLWALAAVLVLSLAVVCIVFMAKPLRKRLALARLQKTHRLFVEQFDALTAKGTATEAARALAVWKNYAAGLKELPLQAYTAKEIAATLADEQLGNALQETDRLIYGGAAASPEAFAYLKTWAQIAYTQNAEQLKHGK